MRNTVKYFAVVMAAVFAVAMAGSSQAAVGNNALSGTSDGSGIQHQKSKNKPAHHIVKNRRKRNDFSNLNR